MTTLGACVLFAVMSNVVLVNFFFDVSVKLFSNVYLVMIAYILALEMKPFWAFFITDEPAPPRHYLENMRPRSPRAVVAHGADRDRARCSKLRHPSFHPDRQHAHSVYFRLARRLVRDPPPLIAPKTVVVPGPPNAKLRGASA